jgi:hypothetical protein
MAYNGTMSTMNNEDYEYNATMSTMYNEYNKTISTMHNEHYGIQRHNEYNEQ